MKASVLIVDDEVNVQRSLRGVLEDSGYEVQTAGSGEECLELLEKTSKGVKEANPAFLKTGDACLVRFGPTKPMAIEQMDAFPQLSRFAIRDMGKTVAAGVCMKIEKK